MILTIVLAICGALYAAFIMFPLKIKIMKKIGKVASNDEIIELAKRGDYDAMRLSKMTKYGFVYAFVFAAVFGLEKLKIISILQ